MKRLIDVTQDDIDKGIVDCNKCAIALALRREYKTKNVEVWIEGGDPILRVNDDDLNIDSFMESDVLDFIDLYDSYNKFDNDYKGREHKIPKPFTLEIVEWYKIK